MRTPSVPRASTRTGSALQLLGVLVLAAGLCMLHPWLGVAVLGLGMVALGVALEVGG